MQYEFDPDKSAANRDKHGIDFATALALWKVTAWVQPLPYPAELRWMRTGPIGERMWTAVYTVRGGKIRLISVRRARLQEVKRYEDAVQSKEDHQP